MVSSQTGDIDQEFAPRPSSVSPCSISFPLSDNTPTKPSQYTILETNTIKHPLREHWDESVGHGVRRLIRTFQQHSRLPCKVWSTSEMTTKVYRDVRNSSRFYWQNRLVFQREILCGIAAMLLLMPETVAFSYAAKLDPLNGLYATGFLGITVSLFGGVPATVAGAAGAVAMVMPTITSSTGSLSYLTY